ncbi:MAG TPA: hypothetical protein PK047_07645 [Saprospiraceae bacterium]|nr:hypothetical protein [Saprospiraceae bacterium]HRO08728.1 hypothetical protein [Saprospiraceae bacterium]HRP42039.1 hypothetical protein [Saprospiraceae bacterium]
MKRIFLNVFFLVLTVGISYGQEYKKELKNANKLLSKYYLDPTANKSSLDEALTILDAVFKTDEAKSSPEAWLSKGQLYNEIAKSEMTKMIIDEQAGKSSPLNTPDAGLVALEAFEKAMGIAIKKSQTKDALNGIKENEEIVNNIGITFFQKNDYVNAYRNFNAGIKDYEYLNQNKLTSRLDDEVLRNDHYFYTAVAGYLGENKEDVLPVLKKLYEAKYNHPLVYEALFTLTVDKDEAKATEYLNAGKKLAPEDSSLLFAEINYYLREGKLDILIDKLKAAIAKEPDNVSVYTTLGNVYDQINQRERTAGNIEQADKYFNLAFDYYSQAVTKDAKNFDAVYSQGALYYNKAASMTEKLNALSNDYTPAGNKKYKALKDEMDGYFNQALPYFIKAEDLDPKDLNVKIALKEIYARQGELEKSQEYKAKIEKLGGQ